MREIRTKEQRREKMTNVLFGLANGIKRKLSSRGITGRTMRPLGALFFACLAGAMLAGCASMPGFLGQPNKKFESAMAKNDLTAMEAVLKKSAARMNLTECMFDVLSNWIKGFNHANDIPALTMLLRYGANINGLQGIIIGGNKDDDKSMSPLMYALLVGKNREVLEFLVNNRADPNGRVLYGGFSDIYDSMLVFAERRCGIAEVSFLVEHGADIDGQGSSGSNGRGFTALMLAAANNDFDRVKYLVGRGANVNLRHNDGSTAASRAYDKGYIEIYT
jgi:hypothetical protein